MCDKNIHEAPCGSCVSVNFLCDRMKTKNFYISLVLVTLSTVTLWILSSPLPNLQAIVKKTHSGLKRASSIRLTDHVLTVDPVYLQQLGLIANLDPMDTHVDATSSRKVYSTNLKHLVPGMLKTTLGQPVIASAVRPDHFEQTVMLMQSVQALLPDYNLILYDLGLSVDEQALLAKYCNSSWRCETTQFQFQKYPSHVQYLKMWSFRPICIQEVLNKYGAVIWVDEGHYFVSNNLSSTLANAKKSGIQGWTVKEPTSSVTHPKMFQFFNVNIGSYYFQHAMDASHLVIYNSEKITAHLMLPWVKCALLEECISPPGAQDSGCNYFQRPLYKYTGCHHYDVSALNVILGQNFGFDQEPYIGRDNLFASLIAKPWQENKPG